MKYRKIAAPMALAHNGELIKDALLTLDEQGQIIDFQSAVERLDSMAGVEYYSGVLIPGMVNAHCHLELSYLQGAVAEEGGLAQFIKDITSVRGDYSEQLQQDRATAEDRKMWSEGVQGLCDISNGVASFHAKSTSNILYHTYAEYFNMPTPDAVDEYFERATSHMAPATELGLSISPSPHSTYMVGDALFKKSSDSARLSIHFMETRDELDYFDKRGAMYELVADYWDMTPDFLHYGGHAERLVASLRPDTPLLLVHNTLITREQLKMLTDYFTDVTFVICPLSNYYIERALAPAALLDECGVNVAIGTDSLTSNHKLSMAGEIERLLNDNPTLPLATVLRWATLGGAKGLKAEATIGSFEVGKTPGVVLLEGVDLSTQRTAEGCELSTRRLV